MNESRIFRITISGGIFIFSTFLHYCIFGGEFKDFRMENSDYKVLVGIIVMIASSPALGFILSTITLAILHLLFGYKLHFLFSNNQIERQNFYKYMLFLSSSEELKDKIRNLIHKLDNKKFKWYFFKKNCYHRKNFKQLFNIFELLIKIHAQNNVTEYIVRRWNIFWTHVNNISSIVYGLITGLVLKDCLVDQELVFSFPKLIAETFIIVYLSAGLWQLFSARKSAIEVENMWLSERSKGIIVPNK
jgi:hypothetical protein